MDYVGGGGGAHHTRRTTNLRNPVEVFAVDDVERLLSILKLPLVVLALLIAGPKHSL